MVFENWSKIGMLWKHFGKEERSEETVDCAQKFQNTNLVGLFWLCAGSWISFNTTFVLCIEKSRKLPLHFGMKKIMLIQKIVCPIMAVLVL